MGFFSDISQRIFGKAFAVPDASVDLTDVLDLVRRQQGAGPGSRPLLAAYHATPPFHAPVRRISESLASLPIYATKNGERVDDHPLLELLKTPNAMMTGWQRRFIQAQYMEVLGECFDVLMPSDNAVGVEMFPVPPTCVTRQKGRGGLVWDVRFNDVRMTVPDALMLWRKSPDLEDPYGRGVGMGRVLADEIEIIEFSAEFEKAEFANHAKPAFVIHLPGASKDQVDQFKEQYAQTFQGPDKHGMPLVGTGKNDMMLQEIGRSLKDSEVLDHRKYSAEVVGQTLGVPPLMLGRVEDVNRSTAFIQRQVYGEQCINPRADQEVDHYQSDLLPKFADQDIVLAHEDASPEDHEQRLAAMEASPETATVNERRQLQGLPPVKGGDVFLRPSEMQMREVPAGDVEGEVEQRQAPEPVEKSSTVIIQFPVERTKQAPLPEAVRIAEAIEADRIDYDQSEARAKYEQSVREWAEDEAATLGIEPNFTLLNPKISEFAATRTGEMIKQIDDTTKAKLTTSITDALQAGKSPREIRDDVRGIFDGASKARSMTIARTEMAKAQGYGQLEVMRTSGLVPAREWVSTFDTNTRNAHISLHSTRAKIGDPFVNPETGGTGDYPGDFPSAGQSVNCRCSTVAWIDEDSPALPEFPEDIIDEVRGKSIVREFAAKSGRTERDEAMRYLVWKKDGERRDDQENAFAAEMQRRFASQAKAALAMADTVFGITADSEDEVSA